MRAACTAAGLGADGAQLIRLAENALYRLPGGVVVRVSRPGLLATARREVAVSIWLQRHGFPVVQALADVPNPVEAAGRPVTFWRELPAHIGAGPRDIGVLLRRLHAMPLPGPQELDLPRTDPFVEMEARIATLRFLDPADRQWMTDRVRYLRLRYAELSSDSRPGPVHGDPWAGNVVLTADGPILLDLERFSAGPPEYDLVVVAASYTSYGMLSSGDYHAFTTAYGRDITTWPGFPLLRDIRELRVTTYAGQVALHHPHALDQARHRLACLRGEHGPRPWPGWYAVP